MKVLDRGYWTSKHFYWQSMYHYLLNGARFRSMTFFSACNPAIVLGGMLYDRKTDIYGLLPKHIVPATTIITTKSDAYRFLEEQNLNFPIIVKPNVGLKGYKVRKVANAQELNAFFEENDVKEREWLLQEFLNHNKEFSVLFYKYPTAKKFGVSSFIEKTYPFVTGNGHSTFKELIEDYDNPFLDKDEVLKRFKDQLGDIPEYGEKLVLDVIGNYGRGAKFYSRMEYVGEKMEDMLSTLFQKADGLNFFRIDLKSDSVEDFLEGTFKVLEINGMKSEPLHIYDPGSTFIENAKVIKDHWRIIAEIATEQRNRSISVPSFSEGIKSLISIKKLVK